MPVEWVWVWEAFAELSEGRPIVSTGFGATLAAIPYADIATYARDEGITDGRTFRRLIRMMDRAYLQQVRANEEAESGRDHPAGTGRAAHRTGRTSGAKGDRRGP